MSIFSAMLVFFYAPLKNRTWRLAIALLVVALLVFLAVPLPAQDSSPSPAQDNSGKSRRGVDALVNYLNMAGAQTADEFQPMTQQERTTLYVKSMVNPFSFLKTGFSAGIDQWNHKPEEWQLGAAGYGMRFANILGQYSIQRTVTFGASSLLHEDNRYFNSGKTGFWSRTGYALASGVLARHDDGSRSFSISQTAGVAAGAFLARLWLPPSQHSVGDGAISFGITMGSNIGFGVVKEFLPDVARAITGKHKNHSKKAAPVASR